MKRENLTNTHDKFFKELFSKKEQAREFIEKTFPEVIVKKLDLNTLELDKTEYVSNKLKSNYSDIVYSCRYGKSAIKLALLFEHKSQPEDYVHFQVLRYMLGIWETQLKQGQSLTAIVPLIFYHGKRRWRRRAFRDYFGEIDESISRYQPMFEYELVDLSVFSEEEIKRLYKNLELRMSLLLLKNIFGEKFQEKIRIIFEGIDEFLRTQEGEKFFEKASIYIFYNTQINIKTMEEELKQISSEASGKFSSTAMRLLSQARKEGRREGHREGRKEGRREGLHQGIDAGVKKVAFQMLREGLSNDLILSVTGLTQRQLDYLKGLKEFKLDIDFDEE